MQKNTNLDLCKTGMLELLKYLHKLCVDNKIKYTLEAGTMIGAIRDKGFISWDDDCDVSLVREEYDKLIYILKNTIHPEYIGVYYPENEKQFLDFNVRLYYKKIVARDDYASKNEYSGVFMHPTLDIYPLDYLPEDSFKRRIFVLYQQIAFGLAMSRRKKINLSKYRSVERIAIYILSKIGKILSLKSITKFHESKSKMYLNKNCSYLYGTGWVPEYPGWVFKKELYENVHLTNFESEKFYVLDAYEEVLNYGYGEWRRPIKTHDHDLFIENL